MMFASIPLLTAGALVFISAAVQHLNTVGSRGLAFIFTDRSTPLGREGFSGRAARTLQNNLESAGMVVPAAMILVVTDAENALITGAALTYAAVRIGFTLSYWAGINKLRSFFWGVGMATIIVLTLNAALAVLQ
ncbi:MAPEG family protein [Devosia sp. XK-2]|uniref:MAPEG family protein n=1 Tax=Devosia sp. XK-2 TaxID=3126689 RepID=UPI0030CD4A93